MVFSQKLMLKVTPSYGLSFGTFRIQQNSPLSSIELIQSPLQHIQFTHGAFGLDATFFSYKRNTYGLSMNTGSAATQLKFGYTSNSITDSSGNSQIEVSQGGNTTIRQFGAFYKYSIPSSRKDSTGSYFQHHLSVYVYYMHDRTYFLPYTDLSVIMSDGNIHYDYENYKAIYEGRRGVSIMLRYDFSFLTRKKRNIIDLFAAYQQGFRLMNYITLEVKHSNSSYLKASSNSYGSGFRVGVSKTISIYPNKWSARKSASIH